MAPIYADRLPKKYHKDARIPDNAYSPVVTEKSLPANKVSSGNSLRKGIVPQVWSGCRPSVSEINRMLASFQAVRDHWMYIPSSEKMGRRSRLIRRVIRYATIIPNMMRTSFRVTFFRSQSVMYVTSNIKNYKLKTSIYFPLSCKTLWQWDLANKLLPQPYIFPISHVSI